MTKKRFLLALALMLTGVGGAWAQGNTTPVNPTTIPNQWQLTVPAGNVTLTVEYYGQYTLDSVPTAEGWQVKVNGSLATVTPYTPGSALGHVDNINETDSVEFIPPAELRGTIKAVRLTESVAAPQLQSLQIGGEVDVTIYYLPSETWAQAIQNHPTENNTSGDTGWWTWGSYVLHGEYMLKYTNGSYVNPTDPIDPTAGYQTESGE